MAENTCIRYFPDGTPVEPWFFDTEVPALSRLGRQYRLDEYGVPADGSVQTAAIQCIIDTAARSGGGVLVVPAGTYTSGALHFRQGVHLYIEKDGILCGSDRISDYPVCRTRIEGQSCLYFPALLNIENVDGFVMAGEGVIDGNGLRFWQDFNIRRQWNPACTNKDSQRPRLVFFSHCSHVLAAGLTLRNAAFWTNHLYKCHHVKYLGCRILSPHAPVRACSTDAIDIDACTDVLVKNCYMAVNDDAVALKGGKGPRADTDPDNGPNERILIEDCEYGFCHGCLTFGSESVCDRNIVLRNIRVSTGYNLLWMKLRPDTPQHYCHVLVENITGRTANFLNINPWSQFCAPGGRTDIPVSLCEQVTIRGCSCACDVFFNVKPDEAHYHLRDFCFEDLTVTSADTGFAHDLIENCKVSGVRLTAKDTIDFPDSVTTLTDDNTVIH